MKRGFTLISVALLMVACAREVPAGQDNSEGKVTVAVEAGIEQIPTRAVSDNDGNAVQVNHWVMEVRDASGALFTRQERNDVAAGTLSQVFKVALYKGNSYTFQFWADTKGYYDTADLTAVSIVRTPANVDSLDAFSANVEYLSAKSEQLSATLLRPLAQFNVQTIDLDTLWKTAISADEYFSFKPVDLTFKGVFPKTFNVKTQNAGPATDTVRFNASQCYAGYKDDNVTPRDSSTYYRHVTPATMDMCYVFAPSEKALVDIVFSFNTRNNTVSYKFTSVPYRRNYRTNIKGKLMSAETEWTATISPDWESPDYDKNY